MNDALKRIKSIFRGRLLAPYQPHGVRWMLEREFSDAHPGGILADEMGLGKTVMLIATCIGNPKGNTLIVVPKALIGQWARAFVTFSGVEALILSADDVRKQKHPLEYLRAQPLIIAPYSVIGFNSYLSDVRWGRIVLDEAHIIKNSRGKTHQIACNLRAEAKWCLTGTPVARSAADFRALLKFLGYEEPSSDLAGLARTYVLRRTKADICAQVERLRLPPLEIALVESDFRYDAERELYDQIRSWGALLLQAYTHHADNEGRMQILEMLLRMRQCTTNPQLVLDGEHRKNRHTGLPPTWPSGCTKLDMLREELLAQPRKEKAIVFCHWTLEMDAVQSLVTELGMRSVRFDGNMSGEARDEAVRAFEADPEITCFIVQIDCGGVGLNLQAATRVYINSLHWNATSELQAIGRAHRTGQTQKVVVKRLVISKTIDEHILDTQSWKLETAAGILCDPRIKDHLAAPGRVKQPFHQFASAVFA